MTHQLKRLTIPPLCYLSMLALAGCSKTSHNMGVGNLDPQQKRQQRDTIRKSAIADLYCKLPSGELRPFLDVIDSDGKSVLGKVAYQGDRKLVGHLVKRHNFNVNRLDRDDNTALHWAVKGGHLGIVRDLLTLEADINIQNKDGNTPLHLAAQCDRIDIAREFLERLEQGDINIQNHNGNTPLHLAVQVGNLTMVREFLRQGADVNAQDRNAHSALHLAAQAGYLDVVKELLRRGAEINIQNIINYLWVARHNYGNTPLHLAVAGGHLNVVKELLRQGAKIDILNKRNWTPLARAVENNVDIEIIKCLIANGASVEGGIEGNWYIPPLHVAARDGRLPIVEVLLKGRAKVNAIGGIQDDTPIHFAIANQFKNENGSRIIEHLIQAGADLDAINTKNEKPVCIHGVWLLLSRYKSKT